MNKILVILGPTATGKTDLALNLAEKFNGELVSCDSRQVYKGLDIGAGKYPSVTGKAKSEKLKKANGYWEINGIKVWMYDVVSPKKQYSVFNYVKDASRIIDDILKRKKLPIVVGGTGLYLKALLEGFSNLAIPVNEKLRKKLSRLSLEQLQKKLQKLSPQKWERMNNSDQQNPRRLVRYIELASTDFTSEESLRVTFRGGFNTLKIGLTASREILYKSADRRVVSRINSGMIEETKSLHKIDLSFKRMKQLGLEYGVLADFLQGRIKKKELIKIMRAKIHGFIRRQHTWFKKEKGVTWFNISDKRFVNTVEELVSKWYDSSDGKQD